LYNLRRILIKSISITHSILGTFKPAT